MVEEERRKSDGTKWPDHNFSPGDESTFWLKRNLPEVTISTLLIAVGGYSWYSEIKNLRSDKWGGEDKNYDKACSNSLDGFDNEPTDNGLPCSGSGQVVPNFDNADSGWFEKNDEMIMVALAALLIARLAWRFLAASRTNRSEPAHA